MKRCISFITLVFAVAPAATLLADDWPHWMGPRRDNVWRETGLVERFPEGGPRVVWRAAVAGGFAGLAVADGRVYVIDFETPENVKVSNFERTNFGGMERVLCLDEATGDEIWMQKYPVTYTVSYPAGPRCTPTIVDGKVYTLGAEGHLNCFHAATGQPLWSKNLPEEYQSQTPLWGYSGHPLLDGEKIICVAGGQGSHAVALNKDTGEEIWRALSSIDTGYSPPTIIEAAGVRQLILVKPDAVASVDPESGREHWSVPYEASSGCVILSPVKWEDYLYVGGFNNKSLLLKLAADRPGAEVVWYDKGPAAISPVNVQPFADNGVLYGVDQKGVLRAVRLADKAEQLWETPQPMGDRAQRSGTAFIVRQGDRYWLFTDSGELVIARLTPEGYEEIDRAKVIEPTNFAEGRDIVWSMPAYANRRAYIRNDKECICVDLAAAAGPAD
jgi:outer membrane protein assembly factor BamB